MKSMMEKAMFIDTCVIEAYHASTGMRIRHRTGSHWIEKIHPDGRMERKLYLRGLLHELLVKLHLDHNCMINYGTGGVADIMNLITGLAAPAAYTYIGIGIGTTQDASTDTDMSGASKYRKSVTPTITSSSGSLKDIANWTHVFSHANDASLTGTWAVNEVCIGNAASGAGHILIHIAGSSHYGAVDSMNWDNSDTLSITITLKGEQGS